MKTLCAIGECMLELRRREALYDMGYGGDVFNTAVYAAHSGLKVSFASATGKDRYSEFLINAWRSHKIDTRLVRRFKDATPALYTIETDEQGERSFHYWRDASPFRRWLEPGKYLDQLSDRLAAYDAIYFSGITLALLTDCHKEHLLSLVAESRLNAKLIAFDPNYRPALWQHKKDAKYWIDRAYEVCDLALPSIDDERLLRRSNLTPESLSNHLVNLGCQEVAVKQGAEGVYVDAALGNFHIKPNKLDPIDTTAAGDAFNGAYLAGRLRGEDVKSAAERGVYIASQVIMQPGAIVQLQDV